jgi:hypothetical protein
MWLQLSDLLEFRRHARFVFSLTVLSTCHHQNHWQRNSHLKLEKFATLCHNLNNESSQRVDESHALKEELETIRAERDQMASELMTLRTAVKDFDKEREEHRLVKERLALCENEGLRQAGEAIAQRDDMISLLSTRLETALDTLAIEREQQRQRRQIIFPPAASKGRNGYYPTNGLIGNGDGVHQPSTSQGNGNSDSTQQDELERLRFELAEAQRRLESVQLEAQQKEPLIDLMRNPLGSSQEKRYNGEYTQTN